MNQEERLDELLDLWEDAQERGQNVSPQELCAACPELLPKLEKKISALKSVNEWMSVTNKVKPGESVLAFEQIKLESDYANLSVHAEGGLGIVYAAEDRDLYRNVAIKFLKRQCAVDPNSRRQFSVEAEVTSRLEHPGIVPVYGMGETDDGLPFYTMRFIEGQSLDEAIADFHEQNTSDLDGDQTLEFRSLLNRFISVCKTIAYAHNRGILHRDIKPANVMLGRYGETLVVDWGLAMAIGRAGHFKQPDEKTLMPQGQPFSDSSQGLSGTPAYMSPEQITATDALQPASDIYALGCTLYKLLTGVVPFEADSMSELREKIIRGDFPPPSNHAQGIPKPLQAICLKAMSRQPEDRYATAMELANDVERYLADEPVSAYDEPLSLSFARWSRRHRRVAQTAALAGILLFVLTGVFSLWLANAAHRANKARRDGLVSQSKAAATALASELDRRLLILEGAARDQQLIDALAQAKADPKNHELWQVVNNWLIKQRQFWTEKRGLTSYAWFVNLDDGLGTQIARAPQFESDGQPYKSLGNSYAHREYFHGLQPQPTQLTPQELTPIDRPTLSAPFRSTNHNQPILAFSVPIISTRNGSNEVLGVLGMAVEVFDISSLYDELVDDERVDDEIRTNDYSLTIVHTNPDYFDEASIKKGLIMQHDRFRQGKEIYEPAWLDQSVLGILSGTDGKNRFLPNYQDVHAKDPGLSASLAAFETVKLRSRGDNLNDIGWSVIIQEQP